MTVTGRVSIAAAMVALTAGAPTTAAQEPTASSPQGTVTPWPGHTITYWDGTGLGPYVRSAVRQWNRSGMRMRLRRAPRSEAQVHIVLARGRCAGMAQVGYRATVAHAPVWIGNRTCARPEAYIAHELGHILGVRHLPGRCELMSPALFTFCKPTLARCTYVTRRAAGQAVRLYGGRVRRPCRYR